MNAWYAGLSPREQGIVAIGAVFVAAIIIYLLLLEPLNNRVKQAGSRTAAMQVQHAKLQNIISEYQQLGPAAGNKTVKAQTGSLLLVVENTSTQLDIRKNIKRLSPEGQDKVRVQIDQASFEKVVQWLVKLNQEHAVSALTMNFNKGDTSGLVNAALLLAR